MTSKTPMLVDTNVLVYSLYPETEHFDASRALVESAKDDSAANLHLAPQVIAEFIATVTNRRRVTEPKSIDEAIEAARTFEAFAGFSMLIVPVDVVSLHYESLRERQVTGQLVFDAQLVAVMRGNGVTDISTFNVADFEGYSGINVHLPMV